MENKLAIICGKFDVGGIFFSSKGTTHERSHPQWIVLELQLSVPAQLFFLFSWSFVMHIEKKFHFSKRIFAQTYVWLPLLCRIYEHVKKHAFKCLEYPKELNVEKLHQCYNFRRAITMLASHSKCAFFFQSSIHPFMFYHYSVTGLQEALAEKPGFPFPQPPTPAHIEHRRIPGPGNNLSSRYSSQMSNHVNWLLLM